MDWNILELFQNESCVHEVVSGVSATVTQKNTWLAKETGHDKVVKSSQLASKAGSRSLQVPFLQAKNSGGIRGPFSQGDLGKRHQSFRDLGSSRLFCFPIYMAHSLSFFQPLFQVSFV